MRKAAKLSMNSSRLFKKTVSCSHRTKIANFQFLHVFGDFAATTQDSDKTLTSDEVNYLTQSNLIKNRTIKVEKFDPLMRT